VWQTPSCLLGLFVGVEILPASQCCSTGSRLYRVNYIFSDACNDPGKNFFLDLGKNCFFHTVQGSSIAFLSAHAAAPRRGCVTPVPLLYILFFRIDKIATLSAVHYLCMPAYLSQKASRAPGDAGKFSSPQTERSKQHCARQPHVSKERRSG
jgi:hypothetical protein